MAQFVDRVLAGIGHAAPEAQDDILHEVVGGLAVAGQVARDAAQVGQEGLELAGRLGRDGARMGHVGSKP